MLSACTAYLLLTFLMDKKLEVLQSMIADEDLCCWLANQKLLHSTDDASLVQILIALHKSRTSTTTTK